ncbi:MAG: Holliday junction branch migration protein RuvA [Thiomicrospira sp.]|uniref:Holliday junction branch migration protein RuvA n=1 Tax=Thiomicrospira sp. TaxID=935 RepID=UPI0019F9BC5F|nr:Holliday junction branch migration protein RuvA [Thiomicrospira sp.]MBE0492986.1 Holliday junction branch migration protein RuvA [Thiomicrospira sp.]
MIGFLRGQLVVKQPPLLVIDVNGVGYEVEAPMSSFYALKEIGSEVQILTHMHVREDAMLLFGFVTEQERALFRELIKVSGIGAKMALGILSSQAVDEFCAHVNAADTAALSKVPGIGKKTAERLVIEMRDRLKSWQMANPQTNSTSKSSPGLVTSYSHSAVSALVSLGYKESQAESLIQSVYEEGLSLEVLIKRALQQVKI